MGVRRCAACGKDPADGYASVWQGGQEHWYCHADEGESCYVAVALFEEE